MFFVPDVAVIVKIVASNYHWRNCNYFKLEKSSYNYLATTLEVDVTSS